MIRTIIKFIRSVIKYIRIVGFRAAIIAIISKLTATVHLLKIQDERLKYPLYLRIPTSDVSVYEQIFISNEYNFIVAKQPRVIIDAGANTGLASIFFANKFPNAKIFSIEPEESNFKLLKKNVSQYHNIVPIQAALWNENTKINLIDPDFGNWGFQVQKNTLKDVDKIDNGNTVDGITLLEIIKNFDLKNIDILKIDIEGAEKEVFNETSQWIKKVDSIIIELHEWIKPGCNRSFYNGSKGFLSEWKQGENVYLSRNNTILPNENN